ncbi:MAG: septum formation initiator family protein [Candidatus Moraniibacteriota bacterium]
MNTLIRFLLIAVALGAIIMISLALTQETYRRYQIQKEIDDLQVQAQKKERDNQKLSGMIEYFKTQDFQEKEAKEKLSVQKEGEKVLLVSGDRKSESKNGEEAQSGSAPQKDNRTNPLKWWDYFFAS